MRRPGSFWPTGRSLFRSGANRKRPLMWITIVLAVAAAGAFVAWSRVSPV